MRDPLAEGTVGRASATAWNVHLGRDADDTLLRGLGSGSLAAAFRETADAHADAPALTIDDVPSTHGELDDRAARAAGWLRARGIEPGDRVLLCASNSLALVVAYLATIRVGATAVPAGATLTRPELAEIATRAAPTAAFAAGPAVSILRTVAADRWPVIALDDAPGPSLVEAEATGEPREPLDLPGSATALLAFTSGTTGRPKGVPLSHANLLSSIRAAMLAWRWSPDDVLVHALPLSHQHGLGGVHATLLAGSRAVIHGRFDAARLAEGVADERATVLFAVPAMYQRLVGSGAIGTAAFASLRLAISGSAPLSPALFERATELLGRRPLERYGTTESGLDTSNPYEAGGRPGSVGLPLPGISMAIADPGGMPAEPGSEGEIVFRGPQVFAGYTDGDDTAAAFHPGGWFRTGDIGRVEPRDGVLTITGRSKEVVITGGLNVHPREVELALETHGQVGAAAVVGVASERWGEEVVAFVVPASGRAPSDDDLIAHARARLAAHKCPKRIIAIDELPVNAMGKLDRERLRELAGPGRT
ncbi:MAG TPA: AMP-binding protein [Actinomycetota bacterium]|nr:AMP-binding protein [Actinomycetota bacterium]